AWPLGPANGLLPSRTALQSIILPALQFEAGCASSKGQRLRTCGRDGRAAWAALRSASCYGTLVRAGLPGQGSSRMTPSGNQFIARTKDRINDLCPHH
ncbi:hypothetical protein WDZ92_32835, partial [Nostoc sp. NIES-2111]